MHCSEAPVSCRIWMGPRIVPRCESEALVLLFEDIVGAQVYAEHPVFTLCLCELALRDWWSVTDVAAIQQFLVYFPCFGLPSASRTDRVQCRGSQYI